MFAEGGERQTLGPSPLLHICKYLQIFANICRLLQIFANICQYLQIFGEDRDWDLDNTPDGGAVSQTQEVDVVPDGHGFLRSG